MSGDRYVPRSFSLEPEGFGKVRAIRWKPMSDLTPDQQAASRMQHLLAVTIRVAIAQQHRTVRNYCDATGVSYQRLTAILRGSSVMRLDDIASARRHLRITLPMKLLG